jgi:hypothetical protein
VSPKRVINSFVRRVSVVPRILVMVVGGTVIYALLRVFGLGSSQRRFCFVTALIALFLGVFLGSHATSAIVAIMLLGVGGLLALDGYERSRPPQRPQQPK